MYTLTKVSVPLAAITARAGNAIKVTYAQGTAGIGPLPAIPASAMKPSSGAGQGLLADYFSSSNSTGLPVVSRVEAGVQNVSNPPAEYYAALGLPAPS